MDIKSKIFFSLVVLFLIVFSAYKYDQYVVKRNFIVFQQVSCDNTTEECFVADCDVANPDCDVTPYKKIEKLASNIPFCTPDTECPELTCESGEIGCTITLCSDDVVDSGEKCLPIQESTTTPAVDEESPKL